MGGINMQCPQEDCPTKKKITLYHLPNNGTEFYVMKCNCGKFQETEESMYLSAMGLEEEREEAIRRCQEESEKYEEYI